MNKKRSFLAMLLIFVMCFALVFSGCNQAGDSDKPDDDTKSKDKTTSNQIADSLDKTLGALFGKNPAADVIEQAFKGGKVTVEIDGVFQNVLYMDAQAGCFADVLKVGDQEQMIDLSLYLEGSELAVASPILLGNQAYGIDFSTLEQDLKDSEIWSLLGMSYEELQDQLGFDIGQILDALEDTMDAASDMGDVFADALKGIETTQEEGTVTIHGTAVKAINVKYHVTSQDIYELVKVYLDQSEKLMKDMMDTVAGAMGMDVEQMMSQMGLDETRQELKAIFDEIDIQGDLVVSISPDTQYIMCVTADASGTVEGEAFSMDMDLVLGTNPANSDKYTFSLLMNSDGETSGITAEIVRTTSGSVDISTIQVNGVRGEETKTFLTGHLSYDDSNGAYELALTSDGDTMAFTGCYQQSDDNLHFTLDTMTTNGEAQQIGLHVCVEVISNAEIPKIPSYKNILRLSQEELSELLGGFMGGGDDFGDDEFMDEEF